MLGGALESMGFARVAPEELIREDELEVVPLLQLGLSTGVLDLTGYTRLTEERDAAAELSGTLALVDRSSHEHGGMPVKWLGDGVMVHFQEPAGRCSRG